MASLYTLIKITIVCVGIVCLQGCGSSLDSKGKGSSNLPNGNGGPGGYDDSLLKGINLEPNKLYQEHSDGQFVTYEWMDYSADGLSLKKYLDPSSSGAPNLYWIPLIYEDRVSRDSHYSINSAVVESDLNLPAGGVYSSSFPLANQRKGLFFRTINGNEATFTFQLLGENNQTICTFGLPTNEGSFKEVIEVPGGLRLFSRTADRLGFVVHRLGSNCQDLGEETQSFGAYTDITDVVYNDNKLYIASVTVRNTNTNNPTEAILSARPRISILDNNGVLQIDRVLTAGNIGLSHAEIAVDQGNIFLAGTSWEDLNGLSNIYHMKLDQTLQVTMAATGGFASNENVVDVQFINGKPYIFGTMEHPESRLESVFFYSLDPVTMEPRQQRIVDSNEADTFVSASLIFDQYLGLTFNKGDGGAMVLLREGVDQLPEIVGLKVAPAKLIFRPLTIQN